MVDIPTEPSVPTSESLVTVIVATNRRSAYLPAALESVSKQTYSSWEVLIVDDGSPAPEELDHLAEHWPRVSVLHRPPAGVSVARNIGLAHATGDFVSFLDDDDVWHPDRLRLLVALLVADRGAAGCYSSGWLLDENGSTISTDWQPTGASSAELLSGEVDIPHLGTLLLRRESCIAVGAFRPAFRYGEDSEFVLRLIGHKPLTSVPDRLFGYRRHSTSVMATANWQAAYCQSLRAIRDQIATADTWGNTEAGRLMRANLRRFKRRCARYAIGDATQNLRRGALVASTVSLKRAVGRSPTASLQELTATLVRVAHKSNLTPRPQH